MGIWIVRLNFQLSYFFSYFLTFTCLCIIPVLVSILINIFRLECIYCEHTFKDRTVLKEHMRKKFHKRVNPKNKEYDPYYVINYLEGGQQDDTDEPQPQDAWSQWREEGSDWSDWQEEPSPIVCLFCTFTCGEWDDVINHMLREHQFSYSSTMGKLNFYEQVGFSFFFILFYCILIHQTCNDDAKLQFSFFDFFV